MPRPRKNNTSRKRTAHRAVSLDELASIVNDILQQISSIPISPGPRAINRRRRATPSPLPSVSTAGPQHNIGPKVSSRRLYSPDLLSYNRNIYAPRRVINQIASPSRDSPPSRAMPQQHTLPSIKSDKASNPVTPPVSAHGDKPAPSSPAAPPRPQDLPRHSPHGEHDLPAPAPAPPPINLSKFAVDPSWNKGNLHVVTADNVLFKIDDFLLYAYGSVLADAHELTTTTAVIQFTDCEIESAPVLRRFLELATTLKADWAGLNWTQTVVWGHLLLFLDKWGCNPLLDLVLDTLCTAITTTTVYPLVAFYLAAVADQPDICDIVLLQDWPEEIVRLGTAEADG